MLWYSFETPRRAASNKYHSIFLGEIRKISVFLAEKEKKKNLSGAVFYIIRPLVGTIEGGLNSRILLY